MKRILFVFVALSVALVVAVVLVPKVFSSSPRPYDWRPAIPAVPATALDARPNDTCHETYLDFFKSDSVQIRIVWGYKDVRPGRFVGDRYEKTALVHYLLRPCPPYYYACGFDRDPDDADLFTREIVGPDRKKKQVFLRVVESSVGPDDDANRKDTFQSWQSEYARRAFLEGIQKADVVFYNGHSRDGGGPDFAPPRLTPSRAVDYFWYRVQRRGLKAVLDALKGKHRAKLLGLFSCVSDRHFAGELLSTDPDLGVITSDSLLYYADANKNLLSSLSALLGLYCEDDFRRAIREGDLQKGSSLRGFFKKVFGQVAPEGKNS